MADAYHMTDAYLLEIRALLERQLAQQFEQTNALISELRKQADQNERAAKLLRDEFHENRRLARLLVDVVQDLRGELEHHRWRPDHEARLLELEKHLQPIATAAEGG